MKTPLSALAGIPSYEQHPLGVSLAPGGMTPEEFDALKEDIAGRGLIYEIVLYENKVLDGWHRYRACVDTGTAIRTKEYTGNDPAGFVAACTVLRRRLSSLQRALVGARMHQDHKVSQRDACKRFGISNAVLSMVLKALASKNAAIIKRIENEGDYTRGMLREDLSDAGIVHENYGKSADPADSDFDEEATTRTVPEDVVKTVASSVFTLADTVGSGADDEDDLIGGPMPEKGKRPSHPERKPRKTAAQQAQEEFMDTWADLNDADRVTFLRMVWPTVRPVAEEHKLPGMGKAPAKPSQKAVNG
jgi:hypothetical protein